MNGIISWNTGAPIGLFDSGADPNKDGTRTDRPQFIGSSSVLGSIVGKEQVPAGSPAGSPIAYVYLNPAQFGQVPVPAGSWANSNMGRNSIPGPMFANVDFGISKNFKITESMKIRFDANFFDLFNHANFQNPNGNFADTAFGQSQQTYGDSGGHRPGSTGRCVGGAGARSAGQRGRGGFVVGRQCQRSRAVANNRTDHARGG